MADDSGMDPKTRAAFERLLKLAQDDTGSSAKAADFILAWWNASQQGGWNPLHLCTLDQPIGDDMLAVLQFLGTQPRGVVYPYEYREQIQDLIKAWRRKED